MKTIFISIFEGTEAKNILRTSVLSTLLEEPNVRIVLFTKNQDKADYYRKEFNDNRLIYEVVYRPPTYGLDSIFLRLKFLLLNTETTRLKHKINSASRLRYFLVMVLNKILARKFFIKTARFFDYALIKRDFYGKYFDMYDPDLVFCAHLFDEPEIHMVREAKKRGVKTIGFINSWDKTTARCAIRILPDKFIVFNEIVKKELLDYHAVGKTEIFVGGIPQYDIYFLKEHTPRDDFFKKIKADPRKKLIVIAPVGKEFSGYDWKFIDRMFKLKNIGVINAEILVRFQPNDPLDISETEKRPGLLFDYPGIRFSKKRGVDWDMSFDDIRHLADTLFYADLLICYPTSLSIDSAVCGTPVINVAYDLEDNSGSARKTPTPFYGMTHYKNALGAGGIRLVKSETELIEWTNKYLKNKELDSEGRQNLIKKQCYYLDGMSGERIGKFILLYMSS